MSSLPETRVCSKCHVEKSLEDFYKDKKAKYGRSRQCKSCKKTYHYINREKLLNYQKQYRLENVEKEKKRKKRYSLENAEKEKERKREHYSKNSEKIREKRKEYYLENREKSRETSRKWDKNNPEKRRASSRKRRALEKNAISETYTEQDIFRRWGTCCHLCGEEVDLDAPRLVGKIGWERGLHLEHVVDLAKGGNDVVENVKPSHGICNLRKPKR